MHAITDRGRLPAPRNVWVGTTAAAAACIACSGYRAPDLPEATGKLAVGRTVHCWIDPVRTDPWAAEPDQRRRLLCYVWYPAEPAAVPTETPYFPHWQELGEHIAPADRAAICAIRLRVRTDAPVAPEPELLPVLLFSPGANQSSLFYSCLIEDLVSHGYVVVAMEHSHEGRGQVFPDGTIAKPAYQKHMPPPETPVAEETAFYHRWAELRARDAALALDELARLNESDPLLRGRLETSGVGFFGHSIGGMAATHAARHEARVRAAADMDGLLLVTEPHLMDPTNSPIRCPFLFMGEADHVPEQDALFRSANGPRYRVLVKGANHLSFSDLPFWSSSNRADRLRRLAAMRAYLLAFFDRHLLGWETELLDGPTPDHPDAAVEALPESPQDERKGR